MPRRETETTDAISQKLELMSYARLAKLTHAADMPPQLTEDLLVAVFRRD